MTNCPNCDAPIRGWKCEYCDTVFEDIRSEIDSLSQKIYDYKNEKYITTLYSNALESMKRYTG